MAFFSISNTNLMRILVVFLAFFILTQPEVAGPAARTFFDWIIDLFGIFGDFLDSLFAEDTTTPQ